MTRRRATAALFATVALMNAAMAAASPASSIIAAGQLGPAWGGVPNTAGIVGTGVGAILPHRRGFVIGTVVWAGAIGAVGGPQLLAPAAAVTQHLNWGMLAGPVLVACLVSAIAGTVVLVGFPAARPNHFTSRVPIRGYGWNLCFVGGSSGLSAGLPATERARVEGAVDAAVWGAAATASVASTVVLSTAGYATLAASAAALVVIPALTLLLNPSTRPTSSPAGNTVAAPHTAPHTESSRSPRPTSGTRS